MSAIKKLVTIFLCLFLIASVALTASAQRKKQIAVLDFDFATVDLGIANRTYGTKENLARQIADKLVNSLVALGTCQVVERSQLEKVLSEQKLGTDGKIDASTAAKLGRILGVDALIIGNVSIFELKGVPSADDNLWDNKKMSSRIGVNFRIVDTTTAVVQLSNEQIGASTAPPKTASSAIGKVGSVIGGFGKKNNGPKDEDIRDVVQQAVDATIAKIIVDVEKYLSGALRTTEPTVTADKLVAGSVIEANGPSLIINGIRKGGVRVGDRLYVRRGKVRRNATTNQEIRYTKKVGEVEIVEIQDEVIIGSFTGSGVAEVGDTVTNNPTGAAITPPATAATSNPTPAPPTNTARTATASPVPSVARPVAAAPVVAAPVKQERAVLIPANQSWSDTGLDLEAGKPIEFIATGTAKISPTREIPASGLANRPAPATLPLPGANIGALLFRIRSADGQVSPIQVAGARKTLTLAKGGRLEMGVNDSDASDNSGAFTVTVRW